MIVLPARNNTFRSKESESSIRRLPYRLIVKSFETFETRLFTKLPKSGMTWNQKVGGMILFIRPMHFYNEVRNTMHIICAMLLLQKYVNSGKSKKKLFAANFSIRNICLLGGLCYVFQWLSSLYCYDLC